MNDLPEDGLSITLAGLGLEKYTELFNESGINLDSFINLTKEDLYDIGVTDPHDQEVIIKEVGPMKPLFKEINNIGPPDTEAILANNLQHLKILCAILLVVKRKLRKTKPPNVMVDSTHSASDAMLMLLEKIDDELITLKEELSEVDEGTSRKKKKSIFAACFFLGCLTAVAVTSVIVFKPKLLSS